MSDQSQPPETKPPAPAAVAGAALGVSLFAIAVVVLLGVAAYFAFVQNLPLSAPRVWVALAGAAYFGVRGGMMFSKYRGARRGK